MLDMLSVINSNNINRVLEFGSGQSSYFISDMNIDMVSFDDDVKYSANLDSVLIRDLIQYSDDEFNDIVSNNKSYYDIVNNNTITEKHTRQHNCFYKLGRNDINGRFDMVILDGPNGNGRSIAFNVVQNNLSDVSFFVIDDYDDYPFINHFHFIFPNNELIHTDDVEYKIYKVFK
jgi:hypothetical protein